MTKFSINLCITFIAWAVSAGASQRAVTSFAVALIVAGIIVIIDGVYLYQLWSKAENFRESYYSTLPKPDHPFEEYKFNVTVGAIGFFVCTIFTLLVFSMYVKYA